MNSPNEISSDFHNNKYFLLYTANHTIELKGKESLIKYLEELDTIDKKVFSVYKKESKIQSKQEVIRKCLATIVCLKEQNRTLPKVKKIAVHGKILLTQDVFKLLDFFQKDLLNLSFCGTSFENDILPSFNHFSSLKALSLVDCTFKDTTTHFCPSTLKKIKLLDCPSIIDGPSFQSASTLQQVHIAFCNELKSFPKNIASSLQILTLNTCKSLTTIPKLKNYAHLTRLEIISCQKIKINNSDHSSTSLKSLRFLGSIERFESTSFPYLEKVEITNNGNVPETLLKNFGTQIRKLHIHDCASAQSLDLKEYPNLEVLNIPGWEKLQSLPETLSNNLTKLNLAFCDNLSPESFSNILDKGLIELNISYAPKLIKSLKNFGQK